jgi:glycosyltransferase involved in cell wall biosynthesis
MNILHWHPNFLGGGGVTNAVLGLAHAQSELGHRVTVAAAERDGKAPLYGPVRVPPAIDLLTWSPSRVVRIGRTSARIISNAARRSLRAVEPDVVHIHGEFNADNLWVSKLFRAPIVLSPHGGFHPVVLKRRKQLKVVYVSLARTVLYRRVAAFHALCPAEAEHISAVVPGSDVYCIPSGSEPNRHVGEGRRFDCCGTVNLLFVGRLDVYTKGLDILLDAFALALRSTRVPMLLHLVGPDWDRGIERLSVQAARLGIRDHMVFHGAQGPQEVRSFMGGSDVYIQLSRHDGFPLSVSEALLCGNAAILSENVGTVSFADISSLPHIRIVRASPDEASAAIVQLTSNLKELQFQAASNAEKLRSFFSWRRIADKHSQRYLTLKPPAASAQPALPI